MDSLTRRKWDRAATTFDLMSAGGPEKRWESRKRRFFSAMEGRILFLAVGTGLDIRLFPPGREIVGIDISPEMLSRAEPRAKAYGDSLDLRVMDVHEMDFSDDHFDQIFTSCTFCSVPDPVRGLVSLRRVLRPGGELRMFEHTGSRFFPFSLMLHLMTPLSSRFGPELNRDTVANVERAGFEIVAVDHVYLDVVKIITAVLPHTLLARTTGPPETQAAEIRPSKLSRASHSVSPTQGEPHGHGNLSRIGRP